MDRLTASEMRHIAKVPKVQGQKLLARHLHLSYANLEEDLRSGSFLDYHYDVLQFSANRGMPWNEAASSLMFANDFFHRFVEGTLPQAISALQNLAVMYVDTERLGIECAKKLIQYFTSSVLSHHKLYQFVFKQEQEDDTTKIDLSVEVPVHTGWLRDAQTRQTWDYERRMHNVRSEEKRKMQELAEKEAVVQEKTKEIEKEIDMKLQEQESHHDIEIKIAEELMSSLVANQLDIVHGDVGIEIEKMKDVSVIAAAKQAIPVPPELPRPNIKAQSQGKLKEKTPPASRKSSGKSTASRRKK